MYRLLSVGSRKASRVWRTGGEKGKDEVLVGSLLYTTTGEDMNEIRLPVTRNALSQGESYSKFNIRALHKKTLCRKLRDVTLG
jgi:hypothetical protein